MANIEFWYEFGSTYSYPTVMRIERLADTAGIALRWRPFLLGPILKEQGLHKSLGREMLTQLAAVANGSEDALNAMIGFARSMEPMDSLETALATQPFIAQP